LGSNEAIQVKQMLDEFERMHLLRPSLTTPGAVRAPDPGAMLLRALTRFTDQLQRDTKVIAGATESVVRYGMGFDNSHALEIVIGHDAIVNRIPGIIMRASSRVDSMLPTVPDAGVLRSALEEDLGEASADQALMRAIYPAEARRHHHVIEYAAAVSQHGDQIRCHTFTPARILLNDQGEAVITDGTRSNTTVGVVIRESLIANLLADVFEELWEQSDPLTGPHVDGGNRPKGRDLKVLKLLARGKTDEEVARHLGIAPRTVRREIDRLEERTGARSRLELGVLAERYGWLNRV
jgi:DNA-binding CsgD family transcriptional regulator